MMTKVAIVFAVMTIIAAVLIAIFARRGGLAKIVIAAFFSGAAAILGGPLVKLAIGDVLEVVPLGSNLAVLAVAVIVSVLILR